MSERQNLGGPSRFRHVSLCPDFLCQTYTCRGSSLSCLAKDLVRTNFHYPKVMFFHKNSTQTVRSRNLVEPPNFRGPDPEIWLEPRNLTRNPNFGRKVRKVTPEPEISRYRPPGTLKSDPRNRVRNTPGTGSGTPSEQGPEHQLWPGNGLEPRKLAWNPKTRLETARNPRFPGIPRN